MVPSDEEARILFCNMQDEKVFMFKNSKLIQKRGLVEFGASVHDLASQE